MPVFSERRRYSERPPRYEYILTDTGRDFRPVHRGDGRLGQQALRSRGRERIARRQKDSEGGRSCANRSAERKTAQRSRLCVCRGPCRQQAHTPPLRNDRSKEALRCTVVEDGARQKANERHDYRNKHDEAVVATPIIVPPPAAEVDSRTRRGLLAVRSFLRCCGLPGPISWSCWSRRLRG